MGPIVNRLKPPLYAEEKLTRKSTKVNKKITGSRRKQKGMTEETF